MGLNISGAWGIVLGCERCTSHIKKEIFSLGVNTYEGVMLPIFVFNITPKITVERIMSSPNTGDEVEAYTVHVARKFVLWDLSISHRDRITSMTNRHVEDEYLISQINLAEFTHVNMKMFIRMISNYYLLFSNERYNTLHNISDKLLSSSSEKTPASKEFQEEEEGMTMDRHRRLRAS
ncbi:hypothetical protein WA026_019486 [Henosepilachna vigintioctopunctata]|uniref:Uncharacterized protein n=1 Tax=Henosepilachna vigintioctopunctata TaxID=420089 RepID=A0AAW1UAT0_9CUCU